MLLKTVLFEFVTLQAEYLPHTMHVYALLLPPVSQRDIFLLLIIKICHISIRLDYITGEISQTTRF